MHPAGGHWFQQPQKTNSDIESAIVTEEVFKAALESESVEGGGGGL